MTRLSFFVGKGGVGKTTIGAAYAASCARASKKQRVILLSTDPAHSLADIFQQTLPASASEVKLSSGAKLAVWQVDAEKEFRVFLNRHKKNLLAILEQGSIFSAEDIEPLLDTALPGMAEMAALLALDQLLSSKQYTHIVVDTAPFGHTLRLFELPEHFQRFLRFLEIAGSRDQVLAEHFGGRTRPARSSLLDSWCAMVETFQSAFRQARIFLVTTPEKFSLHEALRCRDILTEQVPDLEFSDVVLNRAVTGRSTCPTCRSKATATRSAETFVKREFPVAHFWSAPDIGSPVLGVYGLAAFGHHVFRGTPLKWSPGAPSKIDVKLKRTEWPRLASGLTLVLGKGGVGKTTVSAALGVHSRQTSKSAVEICSVDPAPSLDDVFQTSIGDQPRSVLGDAKFRASELDSVALFRAWVTQVKRTIEQATTAQASGVHVDLWFERQLLSELLEIVPPGIDEVFATFHILDLLADPSKKVVIDMAPTGHALELLRTPARMLTWTRLLLKTLAMHRTLGFAQDVAVKVAELSERVRELLAVLRDPQKTEVYVVMLGEPLPDRETERLARELEDLGFAPKALFVNRLKVTANRCRRCERERRWQFATLARLGSQDRGMTLFAIRDHKTEIAGKKALQSFTRELWRAS